MVLMRKSFKGSILFNCFKNVKLAERFSHFLNHKVRYIWQYISMSGPRTNHQLHWFQRYVRIFKMEPWNVFRISYLRVGVLSIRVSMKTPVEPSYRSETGDTVEVRSVIILVRCRELHVVADSQTIPYNHIGYEW